MPPIKVLAFFLGFCLIAEGKCVAGDETVTISIPFFSTEVCVNTLEAEEPIVHYMFCTVYKAVERFGDMVTSMANCFMDQGQRKPQTYFEILVEFIGLGHLIEKETRQTCMKRVIRENYVAAIYGMLFIITVTFYCKFLFRSKKRTNPSLSFDCEDGDAGSEGKSSVY